MVAQITDIGTALQSAFSNLLTAFVNAIPGIVLAVILVLVGYLVGKILQIVTVRLLKVSGVDEYIKKTNLASALGNITISRIAGKIVEWYIILIFLQQAVVFLGEGPVSNFIGQIVGYIPAVLAGIIIIVIGLLFGRYISNKIQVTQHRYKQTAASVAEFIIAYMALVMGLGTMGLDVTILIEAFKIGFTALVLVAAIVVGIAFGLAFRKDAKRIIAELKKD